MKGGDFDKEKDLKVVNVNVKMVKGWLVKLVGLKFGFIKFKLMLVVDGLD